MDQQKSADGLLRNNPMTHHHTVEKVEWDAFEHEHREHSADWHWILWIVAIAGAIAAILFNNFLFAALLVIGAFIMSLYASKAPEKIHFSVSHRGITIDRSLYPFHTLESFAIQEDPELHNDRFLLVKSKRMMTPLLVIPFAESMSTKGVRDLLIEELPEEELHLPFSERLMELVGF